jgi:hypothetical protein
VLGSRLLAAALAIAGWACGWILPAGWASAAEAPPAGYDRAGVRHNEQCVTPARAGRVIVRDVRGAQLQTLGGPVAEPAEVRETCAPHAGIRLEGIETVTVGRVSLYYTWPLERGAQSAGFVAADELASAPALDASAAAGNGMPAPPTPGEPAYALTPLDIAPEQRYGGAARSSPASARRWYTYSVYGRPLAGAEFALMSWSWIDVAGGGIARAAVAEGQLFYPADVQAITLASRGGEGQPPNGTVTARYGYVTDDGGRLYGWMVTAHTFHGICFNHLAYAGGGAPLAGTLCPEDQLRDSIGDLPGWLRPG